MNLPDIRQPVFVCAHFEVAISEWNVLIASYAFAYGPSIVVRRSYGGFLVRDVEAEIKKSVS